MEFYRQDTSYKLLPQKQSIAGTFAFLFLSFPFGLCYFILTVIGLALGVGTLVIGIGLPILFITLLMIQGFAFFERSMVRSFLGIPVAVYRPREVSGSFWQRFLGYLQDPVSWTGLAYMLVIKLPMGIVSFVVVLVLPIVSVALTLLPLVYLLNLFIDGILLAHGISSTSYLIPTLVEIHNADFDPLMFARSFIGLPLGLGFSFFSYKLLKGLAQASGLLAQALLAPIVDRGE